MGFSAIGVVSFIMLMLAALLSKRIVQQRWRVWRTVAKADTGLTAVTPGAEPSLKPLASAIHLATSPASVLPAQPARPAPVLLRGYTASALPMPPRPAPMLLRGGYHACVAASRLQKGVAPRIASSSILGAVLGEPSEPEEVHPHVPSSLLAAVLGEVPAAEELGGLRPRATREPVAPPAPRLFASPRGTVCARPGSAPDNQWRVRIAPRLPLNQHSFVDGEAESDASWRTRWRSGLTHVAIVKDAPIAPGVDGGGGVALKPPTLLVLDEMSWRAAANRTAATVKLQAAWRGFSSRGGVGLRRSIQKRTQVGHHHHLVLTTQRAALRSSNAHGHSRAAPRFERPRVERPTARPVLGVRLIGRSEATYGS